MTQIVKCTTSTPTNDVYGSSVTRAVAINLAKIVDAREQDDNKTLVTFVDGRSVLVDGGADQFVPGSRR